MTPMNKLPALINEPGFYKTRNGVVVEIVEIRENTDLTCTFHGCYGYTWKEKRGKMSRHNWRAWHFSGCFTIPEWEEKLDIIEKLVANPFV